MEQIIALLGPPDSGQTELFSRLTGKGRFSGNWPGSLEHGIRKAPLLHHQGVSLMELPGVDSLSPLSPTELRVREILLDRRPDAVLLPLRAGDPAPGLCLASQLTELGLPVVALLLGARELEKAGGKIDRKRLRRSLPFPVAEDEEEAAALAVQQREAKPFVRFSEPVERTLSQIEKAVLQDRPGSQRRWAAVKLFEGDKVFAETMDADSLIPVEQDVRTAEKELGASGAAVIAGERYAAVDKLLRGAWRRAGNSSKTPAGKADRLLTHKVWGLPILLACLILLFILSFSVSGLGNWLQTGLLGEGWFSNAGQAQAYESARDTYDAHYAIVQAAGGFPLPEGEEDPIPMLEAMAAAANAPEGDAVAGASAQFFLDHGTQAPAREDYGNWHRGLSAIASAGMQAAGWPDWLAGLVTNGILAGAAMLAGLLPSLCVMLVLLALLEDCGVLARVELMLDRLLRRFGLSGRSLLSLVLGCGNNAVGMVSAVDIPHEGPRRLTVMAGQFLPDLTKVSFILLATGMYFPRHRTLPMVFALALGVYGVLLTGLVFKKTRLFSELEEPFTPEIPPCRLPSPEKALAAVWEGLRGFVRTAAWMFPAGCALLWFMRSFGFVGGRFAFLEEGQDSSSILTAVSYGITWFFEPLGWNTWGIVAAQISGFSGKGQINEVLARYFGSPRRSLTLSLGGKFTPLSSVSFLIFNLLAIPSLPSIAAMRSRLGSGRWTRISLLWGLAVAYGTAFVVYQTGSFLLGEGSPAGLAASLALIGLAAVLVLRKKRAVR